MDSPRLRLGLGAGMISYLRRSCLVAGSILPSVNGHMMQIPTIAIWPWTAIIWRSYRNDDGDEAFCVDLPLRLFLHRSGVRNEEGLLEERSGGIRTPALRRAVVGAVWLGLDPDRLATMLLRFRRRFGSLASRPKLQGLLDTSRLWLCNERGDISVIIGEPRALSNKGVWAHFQAAQELWRNPRRQGHHHRDSWVLRQGGAERVRQPAAAALVVFAVGAASGLAPQGGAPPRLVVMADELWLHVPQHA